MKLQVSYGYNTVVIDNLLCVYTGKIRVKLANEEDINEWYGLGFNIIRGKNGCIIVSYAVTSSIEHHNNITTINNLLCDIMHKRIDAKYHPQFQPYLQVEESDFPF